MVTYFHRKMLRTPPFGGAYGFSLLEISIVLIIIAVIMGSGMIMLTASVKTHQADETIRKMQVIQKALLEYRRAFNKLPCPSDIALVISNAEFGVAAGKNSLDDNTCYEASPVAPFTNGEQAGGGVPVKTLALPDEYAFDGWGRRFAYAVDGYLTARNAFDTYASTDSTTRLTINNGDGTAKTTYAIYVLISHGENGHGAFPRNGGSTRVNMGSTNTSEQQNCDCNASATYTGMDSIYVQTPHVINPTTVEDSFDDFVVYATRSELLSGVE